MREPSRVKWVRLPHRSEASAANVPERLVERDAP